MAIGNTSLMLFVNKQTNYNNNNLCSLQENVHINIHKAHTIEQI